MIYGILYWCLGVIFAKSTYTYCGRKVGTRKNSGKIFTTLCKVILESVRGRFTNIDDKMYSNLVGRWLTVCKNKKTGQPAVVEDM